MTSSGTKRARPSRSSTARKTATKGSGSSSASKGSGTKGSGTKRSGSASGSGTGSTGKGSSQGSRRDPTPVQVAAKAAEQLLTLTSRETEGVTAMERTDDGWTVHVEVLELRRLPTTTDVLAVYEVTTDEQGELKGYQRVRRYTRGSAEDG